MTISLQDQAIIVPADIASCGTMAQISLPKQSRRYETMASVAARSPPGVCSTRSRPLLLSTPQIAFMRPLTSLSDIDVSGANCSLQPTGVTADHIPIPRRGQRHKGVLSKVIERASSEHSGQRIVPRTHYLVVLAI